MEGDSGHMAVEEVLHQLLERWYFDLGSSWMVSKVVVPCSSAGAVAGTVVVAVAQMELALAALN
jgi:hypothetical protein